VADGIRTRDHRDHNPGLYQLSYRHHARDRIAARFRALCSRQLARGSDPGHVHYGRVEVQQECANFVRTMRRAPPTQIRRFSSIAAKRVSGNEMTKKITITAP
jgi:hypothetical protein